MPRSIPQTYSIFEQPWWLEATAPNQWDAVEIEESGRVVARLPFVFKKKYGLRIVGQPALTPTLGPWIENSDESHTEKLAREKDLFNKLISKLPTFDAFLQNFHPSVTNWLPFYWRGYSQTTRYTYVLREIRDLDTLYYRMSKGTRKDIRKAENQVSIIAEPSVAQVLDMASLSFERQGLALPYPRELLERIDEAVTAHAKKISFSSVDQDGRVHATVYAVGDSRRVYSLVSGNDPNFRKSQSGLLLRWRAIQSAAEFSSVFDFEGSMIEGVEEFYRKFAAHQTPYMSVSKHGRLLTGALAVRNMLRK